MTAVRFSELLRRRTGAAGRRSGPLLWIRVFRVVVWLLVLAGPVMASVVAVQLSGLSHRVEVMGQQTHVELPAESAGAEGFAELFVAAHLSSDGATDSAPSLDASSARAEDQVWLAARTVSLGAEEIAPGYFAVTVAADLMAKDPTVREQPSWLSVGTRFYTVGVVDTGSGWVATGPPTLVAAPPSGTPPELLIERRDGLRDVPGLEEAVTRFLAAYLTGEGELTRYTSPGSPLSAVQPPPFSTVEIVEAGSALGSNGERQVAALAVGTDDGGRTQVLQYALVVAEREGRWEVAELLPAPVLATGNDG
ncbi:MAG: conjugal transfer protein [Acidimicrobiia bacterium]